MKQVPLGQAEPDGVAGPAAEKRDNCFTGWGAPHLGQRSGTSLDDLAKCSNWWPQRRHRYSNSGIQGSGGCSVFVATRANQEFLSMLYAALAPDKGVRGMANIPAVSPPRQQGLRAQAYPELWAVRNHCMQRCCNGSRNGRERADAGFCHRARSLWGWFVHASVRLGNQNRALCPTPAGRWHVNCQNQLSQVATECYESKPNESGGGGTGQRLL